MSDTRGMPGSGPAAEHYDQPRGRHASGYQEPEPAGYRGTAPATGYEPELGAAAWTGRILAGTLMIISGALSFLVGLAAITRAAFFVYSPSYAYHWSVHGWGWGELILGIVVFAAGVSVFLGMLWARIVGVVLAVISAIGNFLFIPYHPVWAILIIGVDVFMIWALSTSGQRAAR